MKITDYGDMLGKVQRKPCLAYIAFGSYQGEWVAVLDVGENIELWKGYYGSCSGCDWIEAERGWDKEDVDDDKAQDYFKEDRYFALIPKELIERIDVDAFSEMLPANVRGDIYEFSAADLLKAIKEGLRKGSKQ